MRYSNWIETVKKLSLKTKGRVSRERPTEDDKTGDEEEAAVVFLRVFPQVGRPRHSIGKMSSTILHLLILTSIIAISTCLKQYENLGNFGQNNQLAHGPKAPRQVAASSCPEKNGRFPVANQCDAYIECKDGVPEEKLCPEGLLFNPEARFNYPCGYPIDIDCEGRPNRQPPQPTDDCPHQYGYFKIGDRQRCGQFVNCADGRGYIFDCPEGLAFNPESYRCDWPDQVPDCDAEAFLGFRCPDEGAASTSYFGSAVRFFRSETDCQRYYICVNGKPRLQNCGDGNAFNDLIGGCDAAENVTGCEPEVDPQLTRKQQTRLF